MRFLFALVVLLIAALAVQLADASSLNVFWPAYIYPSSWSSSGVYKEGVGHIVVNPSSGPGQKTDALYVSSINAAKRAGKKVLGYIHTAWAKRDLEKVLKDLQGYKQLGYAIDGIFVDETSVKADDISYYKKIFDSAKGMNLQVWLNPGAYPDEAYMTVSDGIVVIENNYDEYINGYHEIPSWVYNYGATKFVHIVHSSPALSVGDILNTMRVACQRNAFHVFITDDTGDSPYDQPPSYLAALLQGAMAPATCGRDVVLPGQVKGKGASIPTWLKQLTKKLKKFKDL